jgi:hypothetical protein
MTCEIVETPVSKVPACGDLFGLYTHQHGLADSSLATEREITIKISRHLERYCGTFKVEPERVVG